MSLLDFLTIVSYAALTVDISFQIARIHRTKSSNDLSMIGLTIRYAAIIIIMFKLLSVGDVPLIIGHGATGLIFSLYFVLAMVYFRHRKKS